MRSIQHYINGQSVGIATQKTHAVLNPATEKQVAEIQHATSKEVNQAVAAAKAQSTKNKNTAAVLSPVF